MKRYFGYRVALSIVLMAPLVVATSAWSEDQAAPAASAAAPAGTTNTNAVVPNTAPAAPQVSATKFDDWYLRCAAPKNASTQKSCEVAQVAQVNDNGKPVTVLTLAFAKEQIPAADAKEKTTAPTKSDNLTLTGLVPLNVYLPSGLGLKLDGKDLPLMAYRNCNAAGCWSQIKVNPQEAAAIYMKAKTASAKLQLINGQKVNVTFSTKGLDGALAALMK